MIRIIITNESGGFKTSEEVLAEIKITREEVGEEGSVEFGNYNIEYKLPQYWDGISSFRIDQYERVSGFLPLVGRVIAEILKR